MTTSSRLTELVFRSFFSGDVAVPARGMQRLPELLAAELPPGTVRLSTTVRGEGHTGARAATTRWYASVVSPLAAPDLVLARMDPADLPTLRREVRVDDRLWVSGDHRDTASLQGALVSGRRTAQAILAAA